VHLGILALLAIQYQEGHLHHLYLAPQWDLGDQEGLVCQADHLDQEDQSDQLDLLDRVQKHRHSKLL
jgi:hypothetical protein